MNQRLFGYDQAFAHPVTLWISIAVASILAIVPLLLCLLSASGKLQREQRTELWSRYLSWLVIVPLLIGPILLGAFWLILQMALLSLLCYREYARLTGCFRERLVSLIVVLGTLLAFFAVLDHWYDLFVAIWPLTVGAICIAGVLQDRPRGYVQRVAVGVLGFSMFGASLGHLAYFGNDVDYRPILLMLLLGVQMNDVFAYVTGRLLGKRKLAPNTSPGKTWGGALGALVLTTPLVAVLAHFVFEGSPLDRWHLLLGLGALVSVLGQLGDLMLSSIKRDVGVKDTGQLIPGHGGLLDRFDSTLLVAPASFHYIGYFVGIGTEYGAQRILTG